MPDLNSRCLGFQLLQTPGLGRQLLYSGPKRVPPLFRSITENIFRQICPSRDSFRVRNWIDGLWRSPEHGVVSILVT
jgi:hypothetical protein